MKQLFDIDSIPNSFVEFNRTETIIFGPNLQTKPVRRKYYTGIVNADVNVRV